MRTHWHAVNNFVMGKYFHKRLYEYYPQRPARFVDFLVNLPTKGTFFKYLLFLCFLKFIFFHKYCKYAILPVVSYSTSTLLRLQKETGCL